MRILYIVLLVCMVAVIGVATALYWRVRHHVRRTDAQPDETTLHLRKHQAEKQKRP